MLSDNGRGIRPTKPDTGPLQNTLKNFDFKMKELFCK